MFSVMVGAATTVALRGLGWGVWLTAVNRAALRGVKLDVSVIGQHPSTLSEPSAWLISADKRRF